MTLHKATAVLAFLAAGLAAPVAAQIVLPPVPSGCKQTLPSPVAQPPAGSPPVFLFLEICKTMKVTGASGQELSDAYNQIRLPLSVSQPSRGRWTPFTRDVEQTVFSDLEGLRSRRFIETATSEVNDYVFPNGTVGKVITYHVVEREGEAALLLKGAPRGYEPRDDIDEFRAFLAKGTVEKSGRCALPDGTTRAVHSTVAFRTGRAYRCVEEWVPVSGASPVRQVFERQVKWKAFHPVVPLSWANRL